MRRALWTLAPIAARAAAPSSALGLRLGRIRSCAAIPTRATSSSSSSSSTSRSSTAGGMAVPTVPYTGVAAWYGRDLAKDEARWIHRFTEDEIAHIDRAVDGVLARGVPIEATTKADFDFGPFNDVLARVLDQVVNGIGFILFRGLPVHRCAAGSLARRTLCLRPALATPPSSPFLIPAPVPPWSSDPRPEPRLDLIPPPGTLWKSRRWRTGAWACTWAGRSRRTPRAT